MISGGYPGHGQLADIARFGSVRDGTYHKQNVERSLHVWHRRRMSRTLAADSPELAPVALSFPLQAEVSNKKTKRKKLPPRIVYALRFI